MEKTKRETSAFYVSQMYPLKGNLLRWKLPNVIIVH